MKETLSGGREEGRFAGLGREFRQLWQEVEAGRQESIPEGNPFVLENVMLVQAQSESVLEAGTAESMAGGLAIANPSLDRRETILVASNIITAEMLQSNDSDSVMTLRPANTTGGRSAIRAHFDGLTLDRTQAILRVLLNDGQTREMRVQLALIHPDDRAKLLAGVVEPETEDEAEEALEVPETPRLDALLGVENFGQVWSKSRKESLAALGITPEYLAPHTNRFVNRYDSANPLERAEEELDEILFPHDLSADLRWYYTEDRSIQGHPVMHTVVSEPRVNGGVEKVRFSFHHMASAPDRSFLQRQNKEIEGKVRAALGEPSETEDGNGKEVLIWNVENCELRLILSEAGTDIVIRPLESDPRVQRQVLRGTGDLFSGQETEAVVVPLDGHQQGGSVGCIPAVFATLLNQGGVPNVTLATTAHALGTGRSGTATGQDMGRALSDEISGHGRLESASGSLGRPSTLRELQAWIDEGRIIAVESDGNTASITYGAAYGVVSGRMQCELNFDDLYVHVMLPLLGIRGKEVRPHLESIEYWNLTKKELFDIMRERVGEIGEDRFLRGARHYLDEAIETQDASHAHIIRGYDENGLYVWNPGNGVSHWIDYEAADMMLRNTYYSFRPNSGLLTTASASVQK